MATNITEKVTELISVVEDQGFLRRLELLNPRFALPSLHFITLTPLSYSVSYAQFGGSHTAEHVN